MDIDGADIGLENGKLAHRDLNQMNIILNSAGIALDVSESMWQCFPEILEAKSIPLWEISLWDREAKEVLRSGFQNVLEMEKTPFELALSNQSHYLKFNAILKPVFQESKLFCIVLEGYAAHAEVLDKEYVKNSLERYIAVGKSTGDTVWDWDLEKGCIAWENSKKQVFKYKCEEAGSTPEWWYTKMHPDDRDRVYGGILAAIASGKEFWSEEYRFIAGDGSTVNILDRGIIIKNAQGKPVRMIGSMIDITNRIKAEEALKISEANFRGLADSMPQIIWTALPDGYHDYYNQRWYDYVGKSKEETRGVGWNPQFHPDDQQRAWRVWSESLETGKPYEIEYRLRSKEGSYRWFLGRALPIRNEQGQIIRWFGTCTDIEKQKETEEALKESEDRFRTFANNIQNLAWMANPNGWIFWYNQRWYDYTGTSFEEMTGSGWEKVHHPEHIQKVTEFLKDAWQMGETWELTTPLRGANGRYRWFLTRAYAVKDKEGNVIRWIGTNTDIDDQKRAETALAKNYSELVKINNDLDNFIYTASHDLRAPIANLEGLFKLLISEVQLNDNLLPLKNMIELSFQRFKTTIQDLTEISKVQKGLDDSLETINLAELIEDVKSGIRGQIDKYQAEINMNLEIEEISFSKKNLRSVLYNIISNALKYSDPARRPVITINAKKAGKYFVIAISDNGMGIPSQNLNKIFHMFKRLHDHVEGTGIGLYIVKRIIENAGGKIEVESEVGKGTTFSVFILEQLAVSNDYEY